MEVFLKLKKHCIEIEARRKYERLIDLYLSKNCSNDRKSIVEEQITGLKCFIENTNFKKLKESYPELRNSKERLIKLIIPENPQEIKVKFNLFEN